MAKIRKHLQDKRVVLGGFRTVIKDGDRPLIFMTAHQFIKTFYIAFLFRPLSFFRCSKAFLFPSTQRVQSRKCSKPHRAVFAHVTTRLPTQRGVCR